jgi:hypothetical protein
LHWSEVWWRAGNDVPFELLSEERFHRLDERFAMAISGLHGRLEQLMGSLALT